MESASDTIATFCRAQASINEIERGSTERRKAVSERIKTCRSLILEEMVQNNQSCVEVATGDDPVFLRVKYPTSSPQIHFDSVLDLLREITPQMLEEAADKCDGRLPRMLGHCASFLYKAKRKVSSRPTLSISATKERGYQREDAVTPGISRMAQEMVEAKKELKALGKEVGEMKSSAIEQQRMVKESIAQHLKRTDPKMMTQKVHMTLPDGEWIYFLRCKERQVAKPVGVRMLPPIIERITAATLQGAGISDEYAHARNSMDDAFWEGMERGLAEVFEDIASQTKTVSRVTLDRGAPRKR